MYTTMNLANDPLIVQINLCLLTYMNTLSYDAHNNESTFLRTGHSERLRPRTNQKMV